MSISDANPLAVDVSSDAKPGVNIAHGTFRCRRGYDLYTTAFIPRTRRASACLIFHHGLSDHAQRHSAVLSHLCASLGMPIYAYDAHGHGRSGPPEPVYRNLIWSIDHILDDLLDFTRQHVAPRETRALAEAGMAGSPPRMFLLGYSMGGLACALAAATTMGQQAGSAPGGGTAEGAAAAEEKAGASGRAEGVGKGEAQCANGYTPLVNGYGAGRGVNGGAGSAGSAAADGRAAETEANGVCGDHGDVDGKLGCSNSNTDTISEGRGAAAGACDGGSGAGTGGSGSGGNLYAGLMLTSALTDPLHGNSTAVRLLKTAVVTVLTWLVPTVPLFKRNPVESGIRDPVAVAEMGRDTLWNRGNFKPATVASLFRGCGRLRACARRLAPLPLYVQHATVDVACSLRSMRAFLAHARPQQLEMHVVEGGFHDLHHDPETPVLLGHMEEWLRKRV